MKLNLLKLKKIMKLIMQFIFFKFLFCIYNNEQYFGLQMELQNKLIIYFYMILINATN